MKKKLAILAGAVVLAATALVPATVTAAPIGGTEAVCNSDGGKYRCEPGW